MAGRAWANSGNVPLRYQSNTVSQVRHRATITKLQAKTRGDTTGTDELSGLDGNANFHNGNRALRFAADGNGFAYYPSGNVAVCISAVNSYQKNFFFYADDSAGSLIGFVSNLADGFALSNMTKVGDPVATSGYDASESDVMANTSLSSSVGGLPNLANYGKRPRVQGKPTEAAKLKWDAQGGMKVDEKGNIEQWVWNPKAWAESGHPPKESIQVKLNEFLTCNFTSRQNITFSFSCEGIVRQFDCGEKLRRTESYLENGTATRDLTGKLQVVNQSRKSLQQHYLEHAESLKLARAKLNPKSSSIDNGKLSEIMKGLENYFTSDFNITREGVTATEDDPLGDIWDKSGGHKAFIEEAQRRVRSEIPTIKTCVFKPKGKEGEQPIAVEVKDGKKRPILMVQNKTQKGKCWKKKDGQYMNSIEIHEQLLQENPVLPRSKFLSLASGRYNMDVPVENGGPQMIKLMELNRKNFDSFITEIARPDQLVVVACLRADVAACRKAEQLLTIVNGELKCRAGGDAVDKVVSEDSSSDEIVLVKFDMASSRFLVDRYNIHTVPLYLMYYAGRLVSAGAFGGAPLTLKTGREPPKVLLVENVIKEQVSAEKTMKAHLVPCDLALNLDSARHHVNQLALQRRRASDARHAVDNRMSHGIVMVSDAIPVADFNATLALFRDAPTTMFVRLISRGKVKPSSQTLFRKKSKKKSHKQRTRNGGKPQRPLACPRTGLVKNATDDMTGRAHFACVKPVKAATLEYLIARWRDQDFHAERQQTDNSEIVAPLAMGLSKENLYSAMHKALEKGKKGLFMDPSNQQFGLSMTSSEVSVRGADLRAE